ncbi:phenylalanine 4-monooxygenase [Photobacterium gaetbulicola]|uniref:Phenylalanine-4-hydroxylase n=1 Tax=Photobacterium gaetbulicola Gung47 TaxID=658445 RepID=A0A0C5W2G2_9GAMM|nr:phenylalanine 4-monooxygenase [Photobacterium gaetbulicola]AJR05576.1 phenylalanine 4-monooxygenase [Photobacterium gaetbulicola Gung47]PSU14794.1 phenylalanine 4-monooxygenase [Photobacterium gaetbulicola]
MGSGTKYVSKKPDEQGVIHWDRSENQVWHDLVERQLACIEGRACQAYIDGLELLDLPQQRAPQLVEINRVLQSTTGWECVAVPALINFDRFFRLLANKQFPVATFLRRREEFDYLQEPDFFHEIFGHCAMLTNPAFAAFTHTYGKLGAKANSAQRVYLARLYWFTVEFGLLQQQEGLRIYGGGILSSPGETRYALTGQRASDNINKLGGKAPTADQSRPLYKPFEPVDIMRTPYRIDIMQPLYFILEDINQLYELAHQDIMQLVTEAQKLGLHEPLFESKIKEVS